MNNFSSRHVQAFAAALIALVTLGGLMWAHMHGGVNTHHFLQRADMPGVSNWWNLLILPTLTYFLVGRLLRQTSDDSQARWRALISCVAAALYGGAIAIGFALNSMEITSVLFFSAFAIGLVLPLYRAEVILGFVLAMSIVFGAVIPLLFAGLIASLSWVAHCVLHPCVRWVWRRRFK